MIFEQIVANCEKLVSGESLSINFVHPIETAMYTVYMKKHQIPADRLGATDDVASYLDTIGFYEALGGKRENNRHTAGKRYVPLVHIGSRSEVEGAVAMLTSCISERTQIKNYDLDDVISEIMDNIWSHAMAFGFVSAQILSVSLFFCIADCGSGFLNVLKKAKIPNINNDIDAIKWSIQKGNTSGGRENDNEDEWAQQIPEDCLSSPFGENVPTILPDKNHHAGLGLSKLIEFIKKTKGIVEILSGTGTYMLKPNGSVMYTNIPTSWQGVVVNCILPLANLCEKKTSASSLTSELLNFD